MNITPLEADEQAVVVQYLELLGLLFTATAQSTYTTSHKQKRGNYRQGVRKGFPDLVVVVPANKSRNGKAICLAIEMKRLKGGTVSAEQKVWVEELNQTGVIAKVCKGADEAIELINTYASTSKVKF